VNVYCLFNKAGQLACHCLMLYLHARRTAGRTSSGSSSLENSPGPAACIGILGSPLPIHIPAVGRTGDKLIDRMLEMTSDA